MKLFNYIINGLLIIGGIFCIIFPNIIYENLIFVFGIILIENAIVNYFTWRKAQKSENQTNNYRKDILLINAILTLMVGVSMCVTSLTSGISENMTELIFVMFVVILAIVEIVMSLKYQKETGKVWIGLLVAGILIIVFDVISIYVKKFLPYVVGISTAIVIISVGLLGILVTTNIDKKKQEVLK